MTGAHGKAWTGFGLKSGSVLVDKFFQSPEEAIAWGGDNSRKGAEYRVVHVRHEGRKLIAVEEEDQVKAPKSSVQWVVFDRDGDAISIGRTRADARRLIAGGDEEMWADLMKHGCSLHRVLITPSKS